MYGSDGPGGDSGGPGGGFGGGGSGTATTTTREATTRTTETTTRTIETDSGTEKYRLSIKGCKHFSDILNTSCFFIHVPENYTDV